MIKLHLTQFITIQQALVDNPHLIYLTKANSKKSDTKSGSINETHTKSDY